MAKTTKTEIYLVSELSEIGLTPDWAHAVTSNMGTRNIHLPIIPSKTANPFAQLDWVGLYKAGYLTITRGNDKKTISTISSMIELLPEGLNAYTALPTDSQEVAAAKLEKAKKPSIAAKLARIKQIQAMEASVNEQNGAEANLEAFQKLCEFCGRNPSEINLKSCIRWETYTLDQVKQSEGRLKPKDVGTPNHDFPPKLSVKIWEGKKNDVVVPQSTGSGSNEQSIQLRFPHGTRILTHINDYRNCHQGEDPVKIESWKALDQLLLYEKEDAKHGRRKEFSLFIQFRTTIPTQYITDKDNVLQWKFTILDVKQKVPLNRNIGRTMEDKQQMEKIYKEEESDFQDLVDYKKAPATPAPVYRDEDDEYEDQQQQQQHHHQQYDQEEMAHEEYEAAMNQQYATNRVTNKPHSSLSVADQDEEAEMEAAAANQKIWAQIGTTSTPTPAPAPTPDPVPVHAPQLKLKPLLQPPPTPNNGGGSEAGGKKRTASVALNSPTKNPPALQPPNKRTKLNQPIVKNS